MRTWRVGTVSMGLLLIASGLGLFAAQFNSAQVAQSALKWWPLIFVVLGIETLIFSYLRKEANERVRYDIFSIIMIILLIFSGLGMRLFQETGLAQRAMKELDSENYNLALIEKEISIDQQIKKVILSARDCSSLEMRSTRASSIIVSGDASIRAVSREEAERSMHQNYRIASRQVGDSLYIDINGGMPLHSRIVIPSQMEVEVDAADSSVSIFVDELASNWLIRSHMNTELILPQAADVLITVMGEKTHNLVGNLQWTVSRTEKNYLRSASSSDLVIDGQRTEVKIDNGSKGETALKINENDGGSYQAQARLGNSSHKITIMSGGGEVAARQLP